MDPICRKVAFSDEKTAELWITKLKKTSTRDVIPQRAYLCTKCNNWHLTSKKTFYDAKIEEIKAEYENRINLLENQLKAANQKIIGQKDMLSKYALKVKNVNYKLVEANKKIQKYEIVYNEKHFQ